MNMKLFAIIFFAWTSLAALISSAQAIEVVTTHYPPLTNSITNEGIINRLVVEAARRNGIDVTFSYQPINRIVRMWDEKDKLIIMSSEIFPKKRLQDFHFKSIFRSHIDVMYKSSLDLTQPPTFEGLTLGSVAANRLEVNIGERLGVTMASYPSINSGIKMLVADRIDGIFCATIVCEFYKKNNQDVQFTNQHVDTVSIDLLLQKGSTKKSTEQLNQISNSIREMNVDIDTLLPANGMN